MKKRLFTMAWAIRSQFSTFSEALKHAWATIKLQVRLLIEPRVGFTYKKVSDGTIRHAVGSNESIQYTKTTERKANPAILTYWDIPANGFRSCLITNLIF